MPETKKCDCCGELIPSKKGAMFTWPSPEDARVTYTEWVCFQCIPKECREENNG